LPRRGTTRFKLCVPPEIDLTKLTVSEKDALILSLLPLVGQLQAAQVRIAKLARLERAQKTPNNSSLPPSKGEKSGCRPGEKPPRKNRPGPGVAHALEPNPDRIADAKLNACPHCAGAWLDAAPQMVRDRIELSPIHPDVTPVQLLGGRCSCCGERAIAAAPAGLESDVPATNNVSERALRPSVIFRKVTNGFRSEWGANTHAAFRSVVGTNASSSTELRNVLATPSSGTASLQQG
jgi:hypothetical protein